MGPSDLDLVELHDCFATAELVHYDNLMLCEEGGAAEFFNSGATWRDGSTPVNVSGGLESKGHPIAATGIANVWEICHHLRGEAGDRQIAECESRSRPRHRTRLRVRRPHPREVSGIVSAPASRLSFMRAAVFEEFGGPVDVRSVPDPAPSPGGVVVEVHATGLCRSDWHAWAGHDDGVALPHVPGHELVGVVAAVGAEVRRWTRRRPSNHTFRVRLRHVPVVPERTGAGVSGADPAGFHTLGLVRRICGPARC